jgi:hypothetical protein
MLSHLLGTMLSVCFSLAIKTKQAKELGLPVVENNKCRFSKLFKKIDVTTKRYSNY